MLALVDSDDNLLSVCRKTHLFGEMDRPQFTAGESLCPLVQFKDWSVGLAIFYDFEFSELVRAYALAGAEVVLVPTTNMQPYTGIATRVVPARAEENKIYVAYAYRVGSEENFEYCGLSCVVGPDGLEHARAAVEEEIIYASLFKEHLTNIRKSLSHLNDRRPKLYS